MRTRKEIEEAYCKTAWASIHRNLILEVCLDIRDILVSAKKEGENKNG
jgi:hypothetical protein